MTPLLPHVREPAGEPDVCAYCCEEWMDVDPTEACPLRRLPWVFQDVLPVCPYCQSPVRVYQEHPDHPGWYAECSSHQQCLGTGTCSDRGTAETAWKELIRRARPFFNKENE